MCLLENEAGGQGAKGFMLLGTGAGRLDCLINELRDALQPLIRVHTCKVAPVPCKPCPSCL